LRNLLKYQLPFLAYACLIFAVSSIPRLPMAEIGIPGIDKIVHGLEYLFFFLLSMRAFRNQPFKLQDNKLLILSFSISIIYAIFDEIHQSYIPGRQADVLDLIADLAGIAVGALLYRNRNRIKALLRK
jgi:VanZ family protein